MRAYFFFLCLSHGISVIVIDPNGRSEPHSLTHIDMNECTANSHTHHTALMRCLDYLLTCLIVEALEIHCKAVGVGRVAGTTFFDVILL